MKIWPACRCFLVGHRIYEPTGGVQACERCGNARKWNQRPWNRREADGVLVYPWNVLKDTVSKPLQRVRSRLFCHHCGGLILYRVDQHFCSTKCEQEWFPF